MSSRSRSAIGIPRRRVPSDRAAWFGRIAICIAAVGAGTSANIANHQPANAQSAPRPTSDEAFSRHIAVTQFKSRTVRLATPFASTVIGSPDIADVLTMSDQVIYVQGKKIGATNVSVFDRVGRLIGVLDVEVTLDTLSLATQIRASTGVAGIRVGSNNGQVILSGDVPDAVTADRAVTIAKAATPTIPVVNAMRVATSQQVMLRVRFLEASRNAARDLGVNWFGGTPNNRGFNTGLGTITQAGQSPAATPGGLPLFQTLSTFAGSTTGAPFGVALANLVNSKNFTLDVLITALESKGLVRSLAEPDLVALSGDTASFLAGGELPVPIVQPSAGNSPLITVEYKPFGVQLTFVPTVLANGVINLRMTPSVSELDYTNAISVSGFLIPELKKREARTTIELRDGQSFAIAGLLQTEGLRNIAQVPWLGSVPVLGALFRSSSYQQNETDLVVIVTPHLVMPAPPGQPLATPLDQRQPSNDPDLFVLGQTDVRKPRSDTVAAGVTPNGPYGYIMPVDIK